MANGALAQIDPKPIIARYLAGETTNQIAAALGVTRQGLGWHLRQHAESDWKDAQVILAIERKDKAEEALANLSIELNDTETPINTLSLARIRERIQVLKEQLKSAQWDLERVLKRIYGPSQEVTGKDGAPLSIEIVRFSRVIDAAQDAEVVTDPKLSTK